MDVSLSAHVIMLKEPVEGFSVIDLTEESELVSTDARLCLSATPLACLALKSE
jgi:hypothetical protein